MAGKKPKMVMGKKVGKKTYFVDKNTVDETSEKYKAEPFLFHKHKGKYIAKPYNSNEDGGEYRLARGNGGVTKREKKKKIKKLKPSWKDLVDVDHPSYNKDYMKGFSVGGLAKRGVSKILRKK